MELKDFIKETISQIAESVNELNELMTKKLIVNPETIMGIFQFSPLINLYMDCTSFISIRSVPWQERDTYFTQRSRSLRSK